MPVSEFLTFMYSNNLHFPEKNPTFYFLFLLHSGPQQRLERREWYHEVGKESYLSAYQWQLDDFANNARYSKTKSLPICKFNTEGRSCTTSRCQLIEFWDTANFFLWPYFRRTNNLYQHFQWTNIFDKGIKYRYRVKMYLYPNFQGVRDN